MAKKQSAGLLIYRMKDGQLEVLIAHPGGPFFAKKDDGIWSIPKGLYEDSEDPINAAKREYEEEIGMPAPNGRYTKLGEIKRKDGKTIQAWSVEGDVNQDKVKSNNFEMEWPPRSGQKQEFPEIDRAAWFNLEIAALKLQPIQVEFLKRLAEHLKVDFKPRNEPDQPSLF